MLMKIDKTRLLKYIDDKYNNDDTKLFLKADINFCKDIIKKKKQADEIVTILYQRIEKNNKELFFHTGEKMWYCYCNNAWQMTGSAIR